MALKPLRIALQFAFVLAAQGVTHGKEIVVARRRGSIGGKQQQKEDFDSPFHVGHSNECFYFNTFATDFAD
jgi:hypothetical protein